MDSSKSHVLVIPDVHLRIKQLKNILGEWGGRGRVIFLGDFFDDFGDSTERNAEMARFLKEEVLGRDDYTVLMGNHDLHYHPKCPRELRCSGFSEEKLKAIGEVLSLDDFLKFRWATTEGGFLLTHAGLHPRLLPPFAEIDSGKISAWVNDSCDKALDLMDASEPLLRAGYIRFGSQPVGGVVWMDMREYEHIPNLRQIFGHTPLQTYSKDGPDDESSFCIDTNLQCAGVIRSDGGRGELIIIPAEPNIDFGITSLNSTKMRLKSGVKASRPKTRRTPSPSPASDPGLA